MLLFFFLAILFHGAVFACTAWFAYGGEAFLTASAILLVEADCFLLLLGFFILVHPLKENQAAVVWRRGRLAKHDYRIYWRKFYCRLPGSENLVIVDKGAQEVRTAIGREENITTSDGWLCEVELSLQIGVRDSCSVPLLVQALDERDRISGEAIRGFAEREIRRILKRELSKVDIHAIDGRLVKFCEEFISHIRSELSGNGLHLSDIDYGFVNRFQLIGPEGRMAVAPR